MLRALLAAITLLSVAGAVAAPLPRELVGTYQMDVPGGDRMELRADGSCSMAGEETTWSASSTQLTIGTDTMRYALQGDRLVLSMGTVQLPWKRIAGGGKAAAPRPGAGGAAGGAKAPPAPSTPDPAPAAAFDPPAAASGQSAAANPQDAQARQILMANAWCSFTYNKVSGTSTTRKVVFRPDGVMLVNGGAETYSSGYGGTYAGQSSNRGAMRWQVQNLRLLVDQGGGAGFEDVGLQASRNSNGYIILQAGGREYSMCN